MRYLADGLNKNHKVLIGFVIKPQYALSVRRGIYIHVFKENLKTWRVLEKKITPPSL